MRAESVLFCKENTFLMKYNWRLSVLAYIAFQSREKTFAQRQGELLKLEKKGTVIDGWNTFWEMLLEWSVTIVLYLLGG